MKKILTFSAFVIGLISSHAQTINAIGAGLHVLPYGKAIGINYSIRKQLKEVGENNSISFGLSPALAVHYDSKSGEQTLIEVPLLFQFNTGFAATDRNSEGFGFFLGAGAGVHYITHQGFGYGFDFVGGLRAKLGMPLEVRVGYHMDAFGVSTDVVSISLAYMMNLRGRY